MKTLKSSSRIRAGAAVLALLGSITWAGTTSAAGTLSGTLISNLSTLSYSVGGTTQPAIGSSAGGNTSGAGTATTFTVDNKVNLSVTETGSTVSPVTPGSLDRVTTFAVTNLGNTAQGYTLAAANQGVTTNIDGSADSFDATNVRVFVESGANAGFLAAEDTATAISTLAADGTATVYVVADIPAGQANTTQANVTLTATTTTTLTTTPVAQTTGVDTAGVDIVFADAATVEANFVGTSAARDAQGTARDAYRVAAAILSVRKSATPICDPFNGSNNPKNIPGAAVQYAITITNSSAASASATLTQISDVLETANLTFDPGLISGTGVGTNCVAGTGNQAASGFGALRGAGTTTAYTAPGSTTHATTAGASIAGGTVTINFATLASPAYGAANAALAPNSYITVYFNAFVK